MRFILSLFIIVVSLSFAIAQKQSDLTAASDRAEKSAAVLKEFNSLGSNSLPFEIFRKAKAVAVFSNIIERNLLLNRLASGKGILSVRNGDGWSAPTFLIFGSIGYEFKFLGKKKFDVVFFIMDDKMIDLLKKKGGIKPGKITGEKIALGPVVRGKGAESIIEKASIIYYTFEDGQLSGENFQNDGIFNSVGFAHDNKLNKAIYKKNAQIILTQN